MPNAAAGAHPLNAAGRKYSLHTGGFLILDRSLVQDRQRGDSRMRMPAEIRCRCRGNIEKIQEHKWLDELPDIRRADQARDRSMTLPSGPQRDSALREGNFQYRAHAAIAAMFARAFNMAASLASGPNARPSARTMVTSVNPMKDSTPVR